MAHTALTTKERFVGSKKRRGTQKKTAQMARYGDLPDEMLAAIFSRLPCAALRQTVRAVCARWANVAGDRRVRVNATCCFDDDRASLYARGRWCEAAAGAGHRHCLAYARQRGFVCDARACAAAASAGRLDMLVHLRESLCPWDVRVCRRAAARGHIACIDYAERCGCPWDESVCEAAAAAGHETVHGRLIRARCPHGATACTAAAAGGHLDCLALLCRNGGRLNEDVHGEAVRSGSLACLKLLEKYRCRHDPAAMIIAAGLGRTDIVDYLCRLGFQWKRQMTVRAVARGHVGLVAHVHGNYDGLAPWAHLCNVAAECGHVDMLAWLHEHDHPWSAHTCAAAASRGHLDVLAYLYEHGCPWDAGVYRAARAGGHHACVEYARARGCPKDGAGDECDPTPSGSVDGTCGPTLAMDDGVDGARGSAPPQRKRRRLSASGPSCLR